MADIAVGIVLDDKQYNNRIKAAEKSATSFGQKLVDAGNAGASSMAKLSSGADFIKSKMEGLGTAIAGVGLLTFAASALESVSHMADLAGAIGITTQSMMEMELAGLAAGKSGDEMANMMQKLNIAANSATEGNTKLQSGFLALGLSMQEVNSMAPDERFRKIVAALATMEDPTKRAALAMELLGKQGTKADFKDLAGNIDAMTGTQKEAAEASKVAKDVLDKLAVSAKMVSNEFVALAAPILDWISPFVGGAGQAKVAAEVLAGAMALFAAAGTVTAINSIVKGVGSMATAMLGSTAATTASTAALVANGRAIDTFMTGATGRLGTATAALNTLLAEQTAELAVGAPTALRAAVMADALAAAEQRVAIATQAASATRAAAIPTLAAMATAEGAVAVEANVAAAGTARLGAAMEGTAVAGSTLLGTLMKVAAVAAILTFSSDLNKGEDAQIESSKRIGKALQELTDEERDQYFKLEAAQQHVVTNAILAGKKAKEALRLGMNEGKPVEEQAKPREAIVDNSAVLAAKAQNDAMVLGNRLALEKLQIEKESIGRSVAANVIETASAEAQETYLKEELRIRTESDKLRRQAAIEAGGGDTIKAGLLIEQANTLEKQLALVEAQTSAVAKQKIEISAITELEKQRVYSQDLATKAAIDVREIQRQTAQLTMTQDQITMDNINKRIDAEVDGAMKIAEASNGNRKFDAETEAAMRAKFSKEYASQLMEVTIAQQESIDKSREFSTGWNKAWADYADNANNAANQAKELFSTFSQGFESMFEQIVRTGKVNWKDLLTDMTVQLMKSDVQKLFASMTAPSGSSTPASGGNGFFQGIGKFLGGFASGGFIPAGGYGITGENGPEYVSGPAQITPMNNQATQVVYNINAVDAKSFQQLLAQQPELIYGLSQRGARAAGA